MCSPAKLFGVSSDALDDIWGHVTPFVQRALMAEGDLFNVEDIYERIKSCKFQLWVALKGAQMLGCCITTISIYPKKKVLAIVYVSGEQMDDWLELIHTVHDFAREKECAFVEIYGRSGWTRVMAQFGYRATHTILRVNLGRKDDAARHDELFSNQGQS